MSKELKKTFGHAGIYAVGVILNRAVSFLMLPIYTRYLSPSDYGVMEILELTVDIVSIVTGMGILQGLFKFYYQVDSEDARKDVVSTIFVMIIAFYALSCSAGVMLSEQIDTLVFRSREYTYFIQISFVNLFVSFLVYVPLAYIRTRQRPVLFVIINAIKLVLQLSLNILLVVYFNMGVLGVLYSTFIASSVVGVGLTVYTFKLTGFRISKTISAKLIRFGYPFIISGFGAFILTYADRYFLNYYHQLTDVGLYALGYKFGFLLMTFPIQPIFSIWMVQRFELLKKDDYTPIFNRFFLWFMIITTLAVLILSLFSRDVIRIMADKAYWEAYRIIPIIVAAYLFQACTDIFNLGIYHSGKTKHIAYGTAYSAVIIITLNFLLIPPFGIYGAAWATFVCFFIRLAYVYWASQKEFRIDYHLRKPIFIFSAAAATYLIQNAIIRWVPGMQNIFLSLFVNTVLMTCFVATLFAFNIIEGEDRRQIFGIITNPKSILSFAGK